MKLNRINNIQSTNTSVYQNNRFPITKNTVSFGAPYKKASPIKDFFTKVVTRKELSQEEKNDKTIKNLFMSCKIRFEELQKIHKDMAAEINILLKAGKQYNYSQAIIHPAKSNCNVTFGEFNKTTGFPEEISVWENGNLTYCYEFISDKPTKDFRRTDYKPQEKKKTDYISQNGEMAIAGETNTENGSRKSFNATESGFIYIEGIKSEEKNGKFQLQLCMNFDDQNQERYFLYQHADGKNAGYSYNKEKDKWFFNPDLSFNITFI